MRMFSGAGTAPMLAAATAWDGLASELESAANSFSAVTSGLAAQAWQGPASQAMAAAASPYAGWLSAAAAQASGAAAQAQSVASEFESALAATVHPATVAGNRLNLVSLVMSNLFGQNAPAIAATESQYEELWAQDVAAMVGYHAGASTVAAQLTPFQQLLQSLPGQVSASAQAAAAAGPDVAFSIFGFNYESGTAHASSGTGGIAFAFGANSNAAANTKGFGALSLATAVGDNNTAVADGTLCTATVFGNSSSATGGAGGIGSNAFVAGNNSSATAGFSNRDYGDFAAVAGNSSLAFAGSGTGNAAVAFGDVNSARAGGPSWISGAPGSNLNLALADGYNSYALAGSDNPASANANVATVFSGNNSHAQAADGNANLAGVYAGTNCSAHAGSGNLDAAGVSGLLPGTNGLTASATGGFAASFKFLPPQLQALLPF